MPRLFVVPTNTGFVDTCTTPSATGIDGEPTAVAWWGNRIVVQSREPAQLQIIDGMMVTNTIPLSDDSRADTGVALFHMNVGTGISCSSCHAEGNEDGRTWSFASLGQRRTQPLAGGVMSRAPFHWDGTLETFHSLVDEVMVSRMSAVRPNETQETRFASWVDTIAAPARAWVDPEAVARGQTLFNDATVGCSGCHNGPQLTNNRSFDVGTGGIFQVPSLIGVAARAPYLHNGCASTLEGRFGPCGGYDQHGVTSHLSEAQVDDLVTYLESL
jgi:cytochrome c peroxidase